MATLASGAREGASSRTLLTDQLHLLVDEFNSVPVGGIVRSSELPDAAAIAFLVMTVEDEQADGKIRARDTRSGLFQGRLGFTRAIVLLEEGCEEFSNIHGLGHIRFPEGNISAKFEDIRAILEREGLIEPSQWIVGPTNLQRDVCQVARPRGDDRPSAC